MGYWVRFGVVACFAGFPGWGGGCTTAPDSSGASLCEDGCETGGEPATGDGANVCEGGDDGWETRGEPGIGDEGGAEDSSFGMADDMPLLTNVVSIQTGALGAGDFIALRDVIVISPRVRSETGSAYEFFVQEREGGPYTGLRVRTGFDPIDKLGVTDAIDLEGDLLERDGFYVLDVAREEHVRVVGSGSVPPATTLATADLATDDPQTRAYEGVRVRVERVTVSDPHPCDGEYEVDAKVRVDDRFLPSPGPPPEAGTVLPAIEGILVYAIDSYELAPTDR